MNIFDFRTVMGQRPDGGTEHKEKVIRPGKPRGGPVTRVLLSLLVTLVFGGKI